MYPHPGAAGGSGRRAGSSGLRMPVGADQSDPCVLFRSPPNGGNVRAAVAPGFAAPTRADYRSHDEQMPEQRGRHHHGREPHVRKRRDPRVGRTVERAEARGIDSTATTTMFRAARGRDDARTTAREDRVACATPRPPPRHRQRADERDPMPTSRNRTSVPGPCTAGRPRAPAVQVPQHHRGRHRRRAGGQPARPRMSRRRRPVTTESRADAGRNRAPDSALERGRGTRIRETRGGATWRRRAWSGRSKARGTPP